MRRWPPFNGRFRGRSAEMIRPELADLAVGDVITMSGRSDEHSAFRVAMISPVRELVCAKPDATRVWQLTPTDEGGTRLVTRIRARCQGWSALFGVPLMELGDFPMMRRCLLGIKRRTQRSEIVAVSTGPVRWGSWPPAAARNSHRCPCRDCCVD